MQTNNKSLKKIKTCQKWNKESNKCMPAWKKKMWTKTKKTRNYSCSTMGKGVVYKKYILLDNQSMVDQITNLDLLMNIRKSRRPIAVHCNMGKTSTKLEGDLGGLTVNHNPRSIANVLLLHSVKQKYRLTGL